AEARAAGPFCGAAPTGRARARWLQPAATGTGPPCLRPRVPVPVPAATGTGPPCLRPDRTGAFWGPACAGTGVCWDRRVLGTAYCGPATTDRLLRTRVLRSGGCRRGVAPGAAPGARPG